MTTKPAAEFEFASLLEEAGRALDCVGFDLDVRPEWKSAAGDDHRLQIREALTQRCGDSSLLELSHLPTNENWSISVSHCQLGGGYALCSSATDSKRTLGFDIEDAKRIRPALVARVSLEHEINDAPSYAFLWTSKEATYKALRGPQQPNVIAELRIGNWRLETPQTTSLTAGNIWVFEGFLTDQLRPIPGKGVVFQLGDLIYAFFCHFAST